MLNRYHLHCNALTLLVISTFSKNLMIAGGPWLDYLTNDLIWRLRTSKIESGNQCTWSSGTQPELLCLVCTHLILPMSVLNCKFIIVTSDFIHPLACTQKWRQTQETNPSTNTTKPFAHVPFVVYSQVYIYESVDSSYPPIPTKTTEPSPRRPPTATASVGLCLSIQLDRPPSCLLPLAILQLLCINVKSSKLCVFSSSNFHLKFIHSSVGLSLCYCETAANVDKSVMAVQQHFFLHWILKLNLGKLM